MDVTNPGVVNVASIAYPPLPSSPSQALPSLRFMPAQATLIVDSVQTFGQTIVGLDSSSLDPTTFLFVDSLQEYFYLALASGPDVPFDKISALNKSGYQWKRLYASSYWWYQLYWDVDPVNGSDDNTGVSGSGFPLQSLTELSRRFRNFNLSIEELDSLRLSPIGRTVTYAINLLGSLPDTDPFSLSVAPTKGNIQVNFNLSGIPSVVQTGVVAVSGTTLKSQTANVMNVINVPGIDWSKYVGKLVRLQGSMPNVGPGTTNLNTGIVAAVEKDLGGGLAQMGEQYVNASVTAGSGFAPGQIVEVLQFPILPAIYCNQGVNIVVTRCCINPASNGIEIKHDGYTCGINLFFCELRGPSAGNISAPTLNFNACAFTGQSWTITGSSNTSQASFINCPLVNLVGSQIGMRNHWASSSAQNSQIYCWDNVVLRLNGTWRSSGLPANGIGITLQPGARVYHADYFYGTGNDPTSNTWALIFGSSVFYFVVNCDAGLGAWVDSLETRSGAHYIPNASLPFPLSSSVLRTNILFT